jgi:hypothetical protein
VEARLAVNNNITREIEIPRWCCRLFGVERPSSVDRS